MMMSSGAWSRNPSLTWSSLLISTGTSFVAGMGMAVYLLRLRDRERLRRACSRTLKHLQKGQRAALGVDMGRHLLSSSQKQKVIVLGAGNFGTAMAHAAAANGQNEVVLYMRDAQQCATINQTHYNPKYLKNYKLNPSVRAICTISDLGVELRTPGVVLILALPCQKTPDWLREHKDLIPPEVLLCNTAKGLYLPTKQLMGHAILDALERAEQPLAFLSGPSFAEEILKGNPTALVVASDQLLLAVKMQKILSNASNIRVYTSQDPVGVQLGGALKNPLAVGAGMITGMGFGINTLSATVTRASRELCQLCIAMGGNPATIEGLSGIGDLMLTCFSSQSRNQRCGQRLIKGDLLEDIQKDMTVEGVPTAEVAVAYADLCGLELPIFRTVHALLHNQLTPQEAVTFLMSRPLSSESKRVENME